MKRQEEFRKVFEKFSNIEKVNLENVFADFCQKLDSAVEIEKEKFRNNLFNGIETISNRIVSLNEVIEEIGFGDIDLDEDVEDTINLELDTLNEEYGNIVMHPEPCKLPHWSGI